MWFETTQLSCAIATVLAAGLLNPLNAIAAESAQSEHEDGEVIELPMITVTGERVSRTLQDTSSSVEVYDSERIEALPNATDVHDLLTLTPNMVDTGTGNDLPSVRGVDGSGPAQGANAFLNGTRPRLNLSVDGRSLTYNEMAFGTRSLWDVDQVEIYRGAQSHIQGRNAIAGAVIVKTNDPTFYQESAIKGSYGEQQSGQLAAMASGPLVDNQLAYRVSVDRQQRESFVRLNSYEPVGDPREIETTTARAKLLYRPAALPAFNSMLTVAYYDSRAPQNEALSPPPPYSNPRFDPRRPVFETQSTSGIWDLGWQQSANINWESKLLYTDFANDRLTALTLPYANIDGEELQFEPLMRFRTDTDSLTGLVGGRLFSSSQDEFVNIFGGSSFDDQTDTSSVFAELTYALMTHVDLTVAARYEQEKRDRQGGSSTVAIDFNETYSAFMPKLDLAWKPSAAQTYGIMTARGYNAGGAGMTFVAPVINYTYDAEYVWNYEVYTRQRLDNGRVELTGNLFYNDYDDMQLPYYLSPTSTMIRNADKAVTYGLELGARWKPVSAMEIYANGGLLRTEIESFADSGIEGNEMARSPGYTTSLGSLYQLTDAVDIGGNVTFSDTYFSAIDNGPRGKIPSYWVANMQLGYNFSYGRAVLYAENLFDSDDNIMVIANDVTSPIIQRPRLIGASVELMF
ncbi:MAG: TonB-dependent receptor [Gammaproteobacteria bacterium]|nr:TonB-dependent receptor [Gammaproteobacteria bacterium]